MTTGNEAATFEKICSHVRETALLESMEATLGWDERTYLPPRAGAYRAEQLTYLAGWIHRRRTDPQLGEWLGELAGSAFIQQPHSDEAATIRVLQRDFHKRTRLPQRLVEELTRASVLGQQAWVTARKENDFATFAPHLKTLFALKKEQAQAQGYKDHPYDALLDDFEPGMTTSQVARVLADLRAQLVPLVKAIGEASRRPRKEILQREFPVAAQEQFGREMAAAIGFDFERGRLDITHHPFCSGMGPHDCRITTRYDGSFFNTAFFGILHEAGHGMYDQGLRPDWYGLPPGSYLSLGIHESQSRMWENLVGRSRAFWEYAWPSLQARFPSATGDLSLDEFHFAINAVEPSLIRVEADEATYNLHIIIRFELEMALVTGDLPVNELPDAWRAKYREYLGVESPTDANGCLQDVHWSAALIGYFPTYSLGNLYAAQFFAQAEHDLGGLAPLIAAGNFTPLLQWLRTQIHQRGHCYHADELVKLVTGKELSSSDYMKNLKTKLGGLYQNGN